MTFKPTPVSTSEEKDTTVALIPVACPTYQGLIYRISTSEKEMLEHDEARLFPTREAAIAHLHKTPCPAGLQRVFPSNEAPSFPYSSWDYTVRTHMYVITDAPYATTSIDDAQDLHNALAFCGGTINFTGKWSAERTAAKFRDLVVHKKGSTVVTRRQIKFTSKSRNKSRVVSPITNEADSSISFNFKNPRHIYLQPIHQAYLTTLTSLLTTPPTTPLTRWENSQPYKWDGVDDHGDPCSTKITNYYLHPTPYTLPSHPTCDPTLSNLAQLSARWCDAICRFNSTLRTPIIPRTHHNYSEEPHFHCGPFRTPLVYLNRHRRVEALTALSIYRPHLLALQTYPEACDRLPSSTRNSIAQSHYKLSVSLASLSLALGSRTFPNLPCDHLLPKKEPSP